MNVSIKINLNRLISPELAATAKLRAQSVVHSHFVKTGRFLSSWITMEVKENASLIIIWFNPHIVIYLTKLFGLKCLHCLQWERKMFKS